MNNKMNFQEIIEILKNSGMSVHDFAHEKIPYSDNFSEIALEAKKKREKYYELHKEGWKYGAEAYNIYNSMPSHYSIASQEWLQTNNIPKWEEVEQYGGEGKGDTWYSVKYFPDHDIYIKVHGWYQSYDGSNFGDWDDACSQVTPQQKTITVYS